MDHFLPEGLEDSFNIVQTRNIETARSAFETLMWSEGISEGSELHDSVAQVVILSVADFLANPTVHEIVSNSALTAEFLGSNMVLSGNQHGTGFRDCDVFGVTYDQLNALHTASPAIDVYAGDDGVYYAV